ncbi:hypothetical protein [Inhella sp.]|uniref:hypothetical protein n=1 Tax=Inhella sp. TaxID=1921806 RepID=UPI0035AECC46
MSEETAWERAASAQGTTESERALTKLAKRAFLSLWSYPNVYTDVGRPGPGDGKELCDLLVVFGNDVLLFSDKDCEYKAEADVKVAWPRWYKKAIEKSAKQLAGAERLLRNFPGRFFIDKACETPMPVPLPATGVARYFLICVTRGAHEAGSTHFGGGSSGSLMLDTSIEGGAHLSKPFTVGFPLPSRRFVHVLDELTVDVLLQELDTVPDLVSYLAKKEAYLGQPGIVFSVPGEEDLLARYMLTTEGEEHVFPKVPEGVSFVGLPEGEWSDYVTSPQRAAKRNADLVSYMWDAVIEDQSKYIRAGTARTGPWTETEAVDHERIVRALAAENRVSRRNLVENWKVALHRSEPGKKFVRIVMTGRPPNRGWVFLTIPKGGEPYEDYRELRSTILGTYCSAIKLTMHTLQEAIGIASEPFTDGAASRDFIYVDLRVEMSDEARASLQELMVELDVLQTNPDVFLSRGLVKEFPMPFHFGQAGFSPSFPSSFVGRAERRRMERDARKAAKRKLR